VFLVLDEGRKQRMATYIRKLLEQYSPYRDLSPMFAVELQEHAYQVLKQRVTGLPPEKK
jgi:hypothetical protein